MLTVFDQRSGQLELAYQGRYLSEHSSNSRGRGSVKSIGRMLFLYDVGLYDVDYAFHSNTKGREGRLV